MDPFAEEVATYLTQGGKVFIVPQYSVPGPDGKGEWACPDFVALDFSNRVVVVVEVTAGASITAITRNAINKATQWFKRLKEKLLKDKVIDSNWDIRFLGFIRKDNIEKARLKLVGHDKVAFFPLEDATFPWKFWNDREKGFQNNLSVSAILVNRLYPRT